VFNARFAYSCVTFAVRMKASPKGSVVGDEVLAFVAGAVGEAA
jgi:hypothetical protein